MKQYPSIETKIVDIPIYAFNKLDGNCIRTEWTKKEGFNKFGSRKVLIDESSTTLSKSILLIKEKYQEPLTKIFKDMQVPMATCFFEFYGPSSFAGFHKEGEEQTVTLLDVDIFKKGMMNPKDFIHTFGSVVDIPEVLYVGKPNSLFVESVQNGSLPKMSFEGVVCKGLPLKKGYLPTMFKIKNRAWIEKVKELHSSNPVLLKELL
jgi:hypothetical protein